MTKGHVFRRAAVLAIGGALVACGMLAGIDDFRIGECKGGKCQRDSEPDPIPQDKNDATVPVADTGVPCTGRNNPPAIRVGTPPNTLHGIPRRCVRRTRSSSPEQHTGRATIPDATAS